MASVNSWHGVGNLGRDPEVKHLDNGRVVCNFSLACSEKWKDKASGEMRERCEWVRVVVWGPAAAACGEYLAKGRQVYVQGRLQTRQWDDRDGNKRYTTEVQANNVVFLGGPGGKGEQGRTRDEPDNGPPPVDVPF